MQQLTLCISIMLFLSFNHAMSQTTGPVITIKGNTILLGRISVSHLQQPPFNEWYAKEYAAYKPDSVVTDSLANLMAPYRFEIFLGTWCGDSKREVPRLMKILDDMKVKPSSIDIISVGNNDTLYKQSPTHEESGKNIYRVPHLNIYRDGKEVGRIIETPVKSWEKDMLVILTGLQNKPGRAQMLNSAKSR
ncbi:MAG TPA: hypothetical protein VGD17_03815 [Chitinophagaceae bacterium]